MLYPAQYCKSPEKNERHCFGHKHSLFVQNVSFVYNAIMQRAWLCHQAWGGFHEVRWDQTHLPSSMQAISVWVKTGKQSHGTTDPSPSSAGCRGHVHFGTPAHGLQLHPAFQVGFSFPTTQCLELQQNFALGRKQGCEQTGVVFFK